ncbi:hypothetical protein BDV93DRAFT_612110 [Ceratobasidium sp. AG-I]|nr:hypothetical protein BDV93DRAFT_612110 [Ceratobasidium sp. AG-I]
MEGGGTTVLISNSSGTAISLPSAANLQGGASMFIGGTATVHPLGLMDLRDFEWPPLFVSPDESLRTLSRGQACLSTLASATRIPRSTTSSTLIKPRPQASRAHAYIDHLVHIRCSFNHAIRFLYTAIYLQHNPSTRIALALATLPSTWPADLTYQIQLSYTDQHTSHAARIRFLIARVDLANPPRRASLGWTSALIHLVMLGHIGGHYRGRPVHGRGGRIWKLGAGYGVGAAHRAGWDDLRDGLALVGKAASEDQEPELGFEEKRLLGQFEGNLTNVEAGHHHTTQADSIIVEVRGILRQRCHRGKTVVVWDGESKVELER